MFVAKVRYFFAVAMLCMAAITLYPSIIGLEKIEVLAVALVALAFLPWLSAFLSEFSAGGINVKLREIEKKIETVADQQVRTDDQLIQSATETQTVSLNSSALNDASKNLEALANKYIKTRASLPSGSTRTSQMTDVFVEMRAASIAAGQNWGKEEQWLIESDPGRNLAAVSYLNVFLDKVKPTQLVDMVDRTSQPFIQYWALRTINSYVQAHGSRNISGSDMKRLSELERELGPSIDRGILVRNINRLLLASQGR